MSEIIKTIMLSEHVLVQGVFIKENEDETISIRVGKKVYTGQPVNSSNK